MPLPLSARGRGAIDCARRGGRPGAGGWGFACPRLGSPVRRGDTRRGVRPLGGRLWEFWQLDGGVEPNGRLPLAEILAQTRCCRGAAGVLLAGRPLTVSDTST